MASLFKNNATGVLASGISDSDTSLTLQSGQGARFPSPSGVDYFWATLIDASNNLEIVKVTARSTDTLTIVRAQQSTTARAYSAGDRCEARITAEHFNELIKAAVGGAEYQTSSGSGVTLTAANAKLQLVQTTSYGEDVTLPDARTLALGTDVFRIFNDGSYWFDVALSDGYKLFSVNPQGDTRMSLTKNTEELEGWYDYQFKGDGNFQLVNTGYNYETTNHYSQDTEQMTATKYLHVFVEAVSNDCYAIVFDVSGDTITYGSPVLINAGTYGKVQACRLTDDRAFVVFTSTANSTSTRPVEISGTSITVGTVATSGIGATFSFVKRVSDTTAIVGYSSTTTQTVRMLQYNSMTTANTFGSAVTLIGTATGSIGYTEINQIGAVVLSDSLAIAFYCDFDGAGAGFFSSFARPVNISGTVITLGTQLTLSTTEALYGFDCFAFDKVNNIGVTSNGWKVSTDGSTCTLIGRESGWSHDPYAYAGAGRTIEKISGSRYISVYNNGVYHYDYVSGVGFTRPVSFWLNSYFGYIGRVFTIDADTYLVTSYYTNGVYATVVRVVEP